MHLLVVRLKMVHLVLPLTMGFLQKASLLVVLLPAVPLKEVLQPAVPLQEEVLLLAVPLQEVLLLAVPLQEVLLPAVPLKEVLQPAVPLQEEELLLAVPLQEMLLSPQLLVLLQHLMHAAGVPLVEVAVVPPQVAVGLHLVPPTNGWPL